MLHAQAAQDSKAAVSLLGAKPSSKTLLGMGRSHLEARSRERSCVNPGAEVPKTPVGWHSRRGMGLLVLLS